MASEMRQQLLLEISTIKARNLETKSLFELKICPIDNHNLHMSFEATSTRFIPNLYLSDHLSTSVNSGIILGKPHFEYSNNRQSSDII